MRVYNYIFVASTDDGYSLNNSTKNDITFDDRELNSCGITKDHSFPIIEVIPLYSPGREKL